MSWALIVVSSLTILLVAALISYLLLERAKNQSLILEMVTQIQTEKKDLMNRMMSQDLPTYQTLTMTASANYSTSNDPYIPQTDQAELARLQGLSGAAGFGESLYDDEEFTDTMKEFGADLDLLNSDTGKNE